MLLTNFQIYEPTDPQLLEVRQVLPDVKYLISTEGKDWYHAMEEFSPNTVKILFKPENGVIKSIHRTVNGMWPDGYSVAEIEDDGTLFDDDLRIIDLKVFDIETMSIKDRVYTEEEQDLIAQSKILSLRKSALSEIEPLQFATELEMITDEEEVYLKELKKYVVMLSRVPKQKGYPTDIKWPKVPNKI